jgi:hypothetical protein
MINQIKSCIVMTESWLRQIRSHDTIRGGQSVHKFLEKGLSSTSSFTVVRVQRNSGLALGSVVQQTRCIEWKVMLMVRTVGDEARGGARGHRAWVVDDHPLVPQWMIEMVIDEYSKYSMSPRMIEASARFQLCVLSSIWLVYCATIKHPIQVLLRM